MYIVKLVFLYSGRKHANKFQQLQDINMGLRTIKANFLSVFQELIRTPLLEIMPTLSFPVEKVDRGCRQEYGYLSVS